MDNRIDIGIGPPIAHSVFSQSTETIIDNLIIHGYLPLRLDEPVISP